MEISQLCSVLQISIGSNNEERKKAEEFLKEVNKLTLPY